MIMASDLIPVNSVWKHRKSGKIYVIVAIGNEHAEDKEKWPCTITYVDGYNKTWSRPMFAWVNSFEEIK